MTFHHQRRILVAIAFLFAATILAPVAAQARTHIVKKGETLSSIAASYGLSAGEIARANRLKDADLVRRGQKLVIPVKADRFLDHKVSKGESLAGIAKRYSVTTADIRAHNALKNPNHIVPGQTLRIPLAPSPGATAASGPPANASRPDPRRVLPAPTGTAIDSVKVTRGRWKHIVIHHSGTNEGSGKGMDRYHREERHMENGLAYHFVIGNGNGMKAGEVFIGKRWTNQLDGGHLAIPDLNANSIGICLVGNFEKTVPSATQLDTLEALVRALQAKLALPDSAVTTHTKIHKNHTKCPGRRFPMDAFAKRLQQP
jgi:LysM repeat protein